MLHTSDSQKNVLVDLLLNFGQNLEAKPYTTIGIKSLNIIRTDLDYIKDLVLQLKKKREARLVNIQSSLVNLKTKIEKDKRSQNKLKSHTTNNT